MKNSESTILQELTEAQHVLNNFLADKNNIAAIQEAANLILASLDQGGKILSCGNGGSMCDAMHFAEELTGRFRADRKPIPAIAISDASHISCVANDYGYNSVFGRYVQALGKPEDVLLAISTSGNSENIVNAAQVAKNNGMKVIGLTGKNGGKLKDLCDIEIRVKHEGFADRIQEIHIKIIHILILLIENN